MKIFWSFDQNMNQNSKDENYNCWTLKMILKFTFKPLQNSILWMRFSINHALNLSQKYTIWITVLFIVYIFFDYLEWIKWQWVGDFCIFCIRKDYRHRKILVQLWEVGIKLLIINIKLYENFENVEVVQCGLFINP